MTFGDVLEGLEISEASTILVNGKTPLEKWLPYSFGKRQSCFHPQGWGSGRARFRPHDV